MTITYSLNVSKARLFGFAKLLVRWKGSIYKLLYREMMIFCGLYYSLSFMYRYLLQEKHRIVFEKFALYCEAFTKLIPLSFVLGFYVSIVVGRWWQQFLAIPWPDKSLGLIAAYIHGNDERGRMIRRTLARYLLLLQAMTFIAISAAVKKRFPTENHLVAAGIMTREEKIVYDVVPGTYGKYWVPAYWYTSLLVRARKEGRVKDDLFLKQMLDELHEFRGGCGMLFAYDWISIPLVYTQTVTIATYAYFLANVMGRQYLDPVKGYSGHDLDLYIPFFSFLEFFFFFGWLKVAEQMINPFGEDDDDFELNWMMDRNWTVAIWVVDEMRDKIPLIVKDMYWDDVDPCLPYTRSSNLRRGEPMIGSAMRLDIDPEDSEFLPLDTIIEEDLEASSFSDLSRTSRILNMLMGQSLEKVTPTQIEARDAKEKSTTLSPFRRKRSQKKKNRTISVPVCGLAPLVPASTHDLLAASIDVLPEKPASYSDRLRSPVVRKKGIATPFDCRSLEIDMGRAATRPKRRETVSVDESGHTVTFDTEVRRKSEATAKTTSAADSQPSSRNTPAIRDGDRNLGLDRSRISSLASGSSAPGAEYPMESPFEPYSFQADDCPYDSDQDTITSMREIMSKSKKLDSA